MKPLGKDSGMKIDEAPAWILKFLEKKAPWWLEGDTDEYLTVLSVDELDLKARIMKGDYVYILDPKFDYIW